MLNNPYGGADFTLNFENFAKMITDLDSALKYTSKSIPHKVGLVFDISTPPPRGRETQRGGEKVLSL